MSLERNEAFHERPSDTILPPPPPDGQGINDTPILPDDQPLDLNTLLPGNPTPDTLSIYPYDNRESDDSPRQSSNEIEPAITTAHEVKIIAIARPSSSETDRTDTNRPSSGKVAAAAQQGNTQRLSITRDEPNGPLSFTASESLVPPMAKISDTPQPSPSDTREPEATEKWARIVRVGEADKTADQKDAESSGLDLHSFLDGHEGPFKVVVQGDPVPSDKKDGLLNSLHRDLHAIQQTPGQEHRAEEVQGRINKLTQLGGAAVRESIAISVPDPRDLPGVAQRFAATALSSDAVWAVEETPDHSGITTYSSIREALHENTDPRDLSTIVPARKFADSLSLPLHNEVPGLATERLYNFAVNRHLPPGTETFPVGIVLDNNGRQAGEFPMPASDRSQHNFLLGGSGKGKTTLLKTWLADSRRHEFNRNQISGQHCTDISIDARKRSNFGENFADMVRGRAPELPEEWVTVHGISIGNSFGVRPNLNLWRSGGIDSMRQQMEQWITSVKNARGGDGEAKRIIDSYVPRGHKMAYEAVGKDPDTGKSLYRHEPSDPRPQLYLASITKGITDIGFVGEAKNVGPWVLNQLGRVMHSDLYIGGYPIKFDELIESRGLPALDIEAARGPAERSVGLTSILNSIRAAVRAKNPSGQDLHDAIVRITGDEMLDSFTNTELGTLNADGLVVDRGIGIAYNLATQGGTEELNSRVAMNTANTYVFGLNDPKDRKWVAERMDVANVTDLGLSSPPKGQFLYKGDGMDRPARLTTPHPDQIPYGDGIFRGPEEFLDRGPDLKFYPYDIKQEAQQNIEEGKGDTAIIRAWIESCVAAGAAWGRPMPELHERIKAKLARLQGRAADLRDCQISEMVDLAVRSRLDFLNAEHPPEELINYLVQNRVDSIIGKRESGDEILPRELCLNIGYYGAVQDAVESQLIPDKLPDTDRYEQALGKITGQTAPEQRDVVNTLINDSVGRLAIALKSASLIDQNTQHKLAVEFKKLAGDITDQTIGSVKSQVEKCINRTLTDGESTMLVSIAEKATDMPTHTDDAGNPITYGLVQEKLTQLITAHPYVTPPVDMSRWEDLYGETFPGETPNEQLEVIKAKDAQRIETLRNSDYPDYGSRYHPVDVDEANLIFPSDHMRGGNTWDNLTRDVIRKKTQPSGSIYEDQRRAHGDGRDVIPTYVEALRDEDRKASELWSKAFGNLGFTSGVATPATRRLLLDKYNQHVAAVKQNAQEFNAIRRLKEAAKQAGNADKPEGTQ